MTSARTSLHEIPTIAQKNVWGETMVSVEQAFPVSESPPDETVLHREGVL